MKINQILLAVVVTIFLWFSSAIDVWAAVPLEVYFMDVGQGDGTLIVCPNNSQERILVDLGTTKNKAITKPLVEKFIYSHLPSVGGKYQLTKLVVTHGDIDHYNLIADVLSSTKVNIGSVLIGGLKTDYDTQFNNWLGSQTVQLLPDNYRDPKTTPNATFTCPGVQFYILSANYPTAKDTDKNKKSIVLKVKYNGAEVILPGDAITATETGILNYYNDNAWLTSDVLKLGHHGSDTSSSVNWLQAVNPFFAFTSADAHAGYKLPKCDIIDRVIKYTSVHNNAKSHDYVCANPSISSGWDERKGQTDAVFTSLDELKSGVYYAVSIDAKGQITVFSQ